MRAAAVHQSRRACTRRVCRSCAALQSPAPSFCPAAPGSPAVSTAISTVCIRFLAFHLVFPHSRRKLNASTSISNPACAFSLHTSLLFLHPYAWSCPQNSEWLSCSALVRVFALQLVAQLSLKIFHGDPIGNDLGLHPCFISLS